MTPGTSDRQKCELPVVELPAVIPFRRPRVKVRFPRRGWTDGADETVHSLFCRVEKEQDRDNQVHDPESRRDVHASWRLVVASCSSWNAVPNEGGDISLILAALCDRETGGAPNWTSRWPEVPPMNVPTPRLAMSALFGSPTVSLLSSPTHEGQRSIPTDCVMVGVNSTETNRPTNTLVCVLSQAESCK